MPIITVLYKSIGRCKHAWVWNVKGNPLHVPDPPDPATGNMLANAIELPMHDLALKPSGNLPLLPLSSADEKPLTYYDNWLDSPEAAGSNHGLYAYLEDEDGESLASVAWCLTLRMEKEFLPFKLMENGWKLKYICNKTYSSWRKHHQDNSGNLKRTICDMT
ncbi:hypothetical protein EDC04DRAFT_2610535 [Pisolithus marmoratus]|nr:hypothetical protein EDC04DRAFT_2610535 [Pisolithus marmoratus]